MSNGDSTHCGGDNGIDFQRLQLCFHFFHQSLAKLRRNTGILQQLGALEKTIAVQSRTEFKVTLGIAQSQPARVSEPSSTATEK